MEPSTTSKMKMVRQTFGANPKQTTRSFRTSHDVFLGRTASSCKHHKHYQIPIALEISLRPISPPCAPDFFLFIGSPQDGGSLRAEQPGAAFPLPQWSWQSRSTQTTPNSQD